MENLLFNYWARRVYHKNTNHWLRCHPFITAVLLFIAVPAFLLGSVIIITTLGIGLCSILTCGAL